MVILPFKTFCHIESISSSRIDVHLDNGERVSFDPREFQGFGHGYAGTVYRGQGKTLEETYFLPTCLSDAATSYVALTRHSERCRVYAAREDFEDVYDMAKSFERENNHGTTLQYVVQSMGEREKRVVGDLLHQKVFQLGKSISTQVQELHALHVRGEKQYTSPPPLLEDLNTYVKVICDLRREDQALALESLAHTMDSLGDVRGSVGHCVPAQIVLDKLDACFEGFDVEHMRDRGHKLSHTVEQVAQERQEYENGIGWGV